MSSPTDKPAPSADSFPAPVKPELSVVTARIRRLSDLTRITVIGIVIRLLIIAAELAGVWFSRSAALFVDAVASLFDVLSSLVLLAAIRFAARPPDEDHPFGHGRAEPLAGFQLGLVLCGTGIWMAVNNLFALSRPAPHPGLGYWVCLIPAGATALLAIVTYWVHVAGKESRSTALRAEAVHYQIDTLTSLITTFTLLLAAWWQSQAGLFDHLGATLLSVLMVILGIQAAWENLDQLLDRVPHDDDFARVKASALQVEGVIDVEKMRIQHAGPDAHVNIDIEVLPEISVADSHVIAQQVRAQIQTDWPFVRDVVVHVEPFYAGDH
ncbi:cation diffusion facilitator family transporter [Planctomicrobium sp. SH661]|uniref:cation diffusion facilitator family transporter n=1 Tax=Planctomicrobium sp. SH661 TaxID=3448124 RepID=UPI003F5C4899